MRQTIKLFKIGLSQITRDGVLLVLLPAPFLVGIVFKLGIPLINTWLEESVSFSLSPWYGVVDGLLFSISPFLTAMITSFLILEERDEGINAFYQVTPAAGKYYLLARIGMPMLWTFTSTLLIALLFSISDITIGTIIFSTIVSALMGVALSMMIVTFASNRVEGLAFSKIMGMSLLGLPVVWFVPAPYQYIAGFLPSFWVGRLMLYENQMVSFLIGVFICFLWITVFAKKFSHRVG